mmetsp:Transcript_10905/g.19996  ORF Transcript_10905/g.19996 Transcript_10905/m.19996 type:complete len:251 (-) Transcript_10905:49-801(-)
MAKKKRKGTKKKGKKKAAKPAPIGSLYEQRLNDIKGLISVAENGSDYVGVEIRVARWSEAHVHTLVKSSDTFETIKRKVEAKHGLTRKFRLYKDKGEFKKPQQGEEIKDFSQSLKEADYHGSVLTQRIVQGALEKKLCAYERANSKIILHCEFEPVVQGALLETDNVMMIDGKVQSSIEAKAAKIEALKLEEIKKRRERTSRTNRGSSRRNSPSGRKGKSNSNGMSITPVARSPISGSPMMASPIAPVSG